MDPHVVCCGHLWHSNRKLIGERKESITVGAAESTLGFSSEGTPRLAILPR